MTALLQALALWLHRLPRSCVSVSLWTKKPRGTQLPPSVLQEYIWLRLGPIGILHNQLLLLRSLTYSHMPRPIFWIRYQSQLLGLGPGHIFWGRGQDMIQSKASCLRGEGRREREWVWSSLRIKRSAGAKKSLHLQSITTFAWVRNRKRSKEENKRMTDGM